MKATKSHFEPAKTHAGEVCEDETSRGVRTLAGITGGAIFGYAVGGPAGAALGGLTGLIIGASSEMEVCRNHW